MAGSVPFRYGVFFSVNLLVTSFSFPVALASRIACEQVFSGLAGWDGDGVGRSCSNTHANQLNRFVIQYLMCVCVPEVGLLMMLEREAVDGGKKE